MNWLSQLTAQKIIRAIDAEFARFMVKQEGVDDQSLALLVVLLSVELGKKNACLELNKIDIGNPLALSYHYVDISLPDLSPALERLTEYDCISEVQGQTQLAPLVLNAGRLYLQRYWCYESSLADALNQRKASPLPDMKSATQLFEQLFEPTVNEVDWQKMACATALLKDFCVITGGPGTGKTTTVTKLLALIVMLQARVNPLQNPIIKLVTPTGKAAARLSESIKGAKQRLAIDDADKQRIPDDASTIHRLLGVKPHSSEFIHHQDNKLHLDVLVVDEVSMVDLPMMAKLMMALPQHTKVILLGDKDQLASVEAGSVLADICGGVAGHNLRYHHQLVTQVEQLTGMDVSPYCELNEQASLADSICLLQKSHRFDDRSGIGQLAKAVNRSDWLGIKSLMKKEDDAIAFHQISPHDYQQLIQFSAKAYQPYLQMIADGKSAKEVIEQFNEFQLLCAIRKGIYGVTGINDAIEKQLVHLGLIDNRQLYYAGRPIMISQNDYSLQLFNGDVGLILPDSKSGQLKAWFITPDDEVKSVYPNRLPNHESVYAMTVHKSQGSEFKTVSMLLPPLAQVINNKVINKELIYTGITRAKTNFSLYAEDRVLEIAIKQVTQRASGLADLLY